MHSDKGRFDSKNGIAVSGFQQRKNQRYFIQYANRYTYAAEIDKFYTQSLHFGITPYIGDYGDIHTWLMMKIDHTPKFKNFIFTPHFRFFKDVHLLEVGADLSGKVMFHYILGIKKGKFYEKSIFIFNFISIIL